jgi:hypothetical protein
MDEALDAMGPSDGMSQAQQQKEQELQQREQQVAQAEQQAKDTTHQAQLATKDAQIAGERVKSEKEVFDLQQKFTDEVQRIREDFEKLASQVMGHAESSVREVVKNMQEGATPRSDVNGDQRPILSAGEDPADHGDIDREHFRGAAGAGQRAARLQRRPERGFLLGGLRCADGNAAQRDRDGHFHAHRPR